MAQAAPAAAPDSRAGVIEACLYADLTRDDWPEGLFGLHRRFPGGSTAVHLARFPTAESEPGPRVMLVHDLAPDGPGPLVQLSVSDTLIFNAESPSAAAFEILVDGALVERVPWPEYAPAAASFRKSGAPRYVATEQWPVWGEKGAALRARLTPNAKRLEIRLAAEDGRAFRRTVYDLAAQPLPAGEAWAAVAGYVASTPALCSEPTPAG